MTTQSDILVLENLGNKSIEHIACAIVAALADVTEDIDMQNFMDTVNAYGRVLESVPDAERLEFFIGGGPFAGRPDLSLRLMLAVALRHMTPKQMVAETGVQPVVAMRLCSWLAQVLVAPDGDDLDTTRIAAAPK